MAKSSSNIDHVRLRRYDWDEWLNGDAWYVVQGEDFSCNIKAFRTAAFNAGKRRGFKVKVTDVTESGEKTTLQVLAQR